VARSSYKEVGPLQLLLARDFGKVEIVPDQGKIRLRLPFKFSDGVDGYLLMSFWDVTNINKEREKYSYVSIYKASYEPPDEPEAA
jgi:hypothetical protein